MLNIRPNQKLFAGLELAFGVAVGVGSVIGVGILRTPGSIAALVGSPWLIMLCWALGGIYVLLGVGSYAELATMLPKAGGAYNYIKHSFGNFAGFYAGYIDYLTNAIAPAYFCIVISEYVKILFPSIGIPQTAFALLLLVAFTCLHLLNVKTSSAIQQVMSFIKVLVFVILICALYFFAESQPAATAAISHSKNILGAGVFIGIGKALQLVLGTYDGWMSACVFAEEDKNPGKNIPRSLFIGAAIVITIYMLVNAAFLYVLPVHEMATSQLVAATAAASVFGTGGSTFVTVIAVVSLLSILNVYMMIPSRILFGLSRDGFFVKQGMLVSKGGTPVFALIFSSAIAFALICIGSFESLFSLAAFMLLIVLGLTFASVIRLRKTEPALPRPYRQKFYPFSTLLLIAITTVLFVTFAITDPFNFKLIILMTVVAAVIYFFVVRRGGVTSS